MKHWAAGGLFFLVLSYLFGCANESNGDVSLPKQEMNTSVPVDTRVCSPISSAQPLPALDSAIIGADPPTDKTVYVDDLFNLFASHCGGCHVDVGLGGYKTTRAEFPQVVDQAWVDSIDYNNVNTVMPPPSVGGVLAKNRAADDPVNELRDLLQAWLDAGRPRDMFQMPLDPATTTGPYSMEYSTGSALTNIGTCIPEKALYASESAKMVQMDQKFEAMVPMASGKGTRQQQIGLPEKLSDTDLTTFDSRELANMGVLSYAVTYPQWIGQDSRVMRHIRVPYGTSITFNAATQQFVIPDNSRLYKTIFQRVVNVWGEERWRKIETQVIVAWANIPGKTGYKAVASTAGTYAWNENESQAILVTDPYRSGIPFRDRLVSYIADETKVDDALSTYTANRSYTLRKAHALRSYAIPGAYRCGQCHMGSVSSDFTLGFQPLQIVRRKLGEGGNIDEVGDDEVGQLARFIDYGLITGVTEADILPLEKSQAKTPRNDYELVAQGYIYGNCAHCHNAKGYANVLNPELNTVLDLQPSSSGGIFRFPLESYSPRITRGQNIKIPYITPSLLDIDKADADLQLKDPRYKPKCNASTLLCQYAPWRSLIYRGVDTPFTYSDDLALFPHMPMNTQSIDPRAPGIIGDWMVSIPAVLKSSEVVEYSIRVSDIKSTTYDSSPQPYREVSSGSGFKTAVAAAQDRLYRYHNYPAVSISNWPYKWVYPNSEDSQPKEPPMPSRYQFSPDTFDIVDPEVVLNPDLYPVPTDDSNGVFQNGIVVLPPDNVPDHAHWVFLDQTVVPGDWAPRRPDWADVLVAGHSTPESKRVVELLQTATLSSALKQVALTPLPMTLWKANSSCDLSGQLTVSDFSKAPPTWMRKLIDTKVVTGSEPVYQKTPGEYVHDLVCVNCHGVKGDSTGRQATTMSEMTGGRAVVTDFIDGILVPANRKAVFQTAPLTNATVEDWAARYFTWMGLGGTEQTIPESILAVIANMNVFGEARAWDTVPSDANMLSVAMHLCGAVLPYHDGMVSDQVPGNNKIFETDMVPAESKSLMYTNGDAMLWGMLCSADNEPPVRALSVGSWSNPAMSVSSDSFYDATVFPAGYSIVNQRGEVVPVTSPGAIPSDAYFRWCLRQPDDATNLALAKDWVAKNLLPKPGVLTKCSDTPSSCVPLPFCPQLDKNGAKYIRQYSDATVAAQLKPEQLERWVTRGAINAGLAAYLYLAAMQNQDFGITPDYDKCNELTN